MTSAHKQSAIVTKNPRKEFSNRDSLLTELFEVPHFKSLYNICLSILISLLVNSVAFEYVTKGSVTLGFKIIKGAFLNFHEAVIIWIIMNICVFSCYPAFKFWTWLTKKALPRSKKIWNKIFLLITIIYYIILFTITPLLVRRWNQPIASSLAMHLEQARCLMKIHAFLRTNIPNILSYKPQTDSKHTEPDFKKFCYFLFAPTLIYASEYPRRKTINWKYAASCFLEVFLTIFYIAFLIEKFFMQPFEDFCLTETKWSMVIIQIFLNSVPALLLLLCSFYLLQHSWLNGFAELLKFGDRQFYKDWWNSNTYARYYRTWNLVVHEWLYTYIYLDMYENIAPKRKHLAKFVVFLVSAVIHEYIISFSLGMLLPAMFIEFFIFGTLFTLVKSYDFVGNILLWYSIQLGTGMMVSLYAIELYARNNCPIENFAFKNYFIPQSFTCSC